MKKSLSILIVEDEALVADHLAMSIESEGFNVVDIVDNAEDVFQILDEKNVDLILLDINIIGNLSGIDVAHHVNTNYDIPFIYLTSNTDAKTIEQVKLTSPYGFIVKPFQESDLKPTIDIAYHGWQTKRGQKKKKSVTKEDHIYIKEKHKLTKVLFEDIIYFEACDNYCKIYTTKGKFMLSKTLKNLTEDLPKEDFFKTHRSFVINYNYIQSILPKSVIINEKEIPLSESGRKTLLERIESW